MPCTIRCCDYRFSLGTPSAVLRVAPHFSNKSCSSAGRHQLFLALSGTLATRKLQYEPNKKNNRSAKPPSSSPRPAPLKSTPEPDFGSDDFEEATITFYDSSDCGNATDTEVYTIADLYELYEVADGTSCSASGDFDLYTVIQCSDGSPASVYYEVRRARRSLLIFLS